MEEDITSECIKRRNDPKVKVVDEKTCGQVRTQERVKNCADDLMDVNEKCLKVETHQGLPAMKLRSDLNSNDAQGENSETSNEGRNEKEQNYDGSEEDSTEHVGYHVTLQEQSNKQLTREGKALAERLGLEATSKGWVPLQQLIACLLLQEEPTSIGNPPWVLMVDGSTLWILKTGRPEQQTKAPPTQEQLQNRVMCAINLVTLKEAVHVDTSSLHQHKGEQGKETHIYTLIQTTEVVCNITIINI